MRHRHAERVPFLLPLNAQCTLMEPAASVIALIEPARSRTRCRAELLDGLFGRRLQRVRPGAVRLRRRCSACARSRAAPARRGGVTPRRVVARPALRRRRRSSVPSNSLRRPTHRSSSPTRRTTPARAATPTPPGVLHALIAARAGQRLGGRVALGLLFDPASAQAACAAGVGATLVPEARQGRADLERRAHRTCRSRHKPRCLPSATVSCRCSAR